MLGVDPPALVISDGEANLASIREMNLNPAIS